MQTAIEKGHLTKFHHLSNILDGQPFEFNISDNCEEYIDLSSLSYLHVKMKINKLDETNLLENESVVPVIFKFCFYKWMLV